MAEASYIDGLVSAFGHAKRTLADLTRQADAVSEDMDTLKDYILQYMQGEGVKGCKTTAGDAVSIRVSTRFFSGDMPAFKAWAKANDALDLFENRLHQGNTAEWLEKNPDNVPPGLQSQSKSSVTVTLNKNV